ncbi:MAG: tyrosine-type recombinase/integrase [Gemmatimonadaceae bacterium]
MIRRKRAPGTIDQHGNVYRIRLMVNAKRHTFTVRTEDRRVAEDLAWSKMAELRAMATAPRVIDQRRVSDLFASFERLRFPALAPGAQAAYRDSLRPFRTFFEELLRDPLVSEIRKGTIVEYLAWRRQHPKRGTEPLSERTLEKDRAVLHRVFRLAEDLEWREGNPVAATEKPRPMTREPVILSPKEYDAFLGKCGTDERLRLYLLVLGEAGLRCESEALWLRWEDVDLGAGVLTVRSGRNGHRTKNAKSRKVPMTPRLTTAMRSHFARYRFALYHGEPSPWIFHHTVSRRHAIAGARIGRLDASVRAAAKRAKLAPEWHQHDLRHRRATTWIAAGKPVEAVRKAMGHSSLTVTQRYVHLVDEHLDLLEPKRANKPKRHA